MSQDQFLPSFEGIWARLSQVAVKGAEFNSRERQPHPKCLEGTRVDLLNHIHAFLDDREKNRIVWLHGTAGVGKSAVAFTVAERMRGLKVTEDTNVEKRLAGTFFFSRKHTKRCTAGYFFATLVYQLASNFPSIREDVNKAIRDNPALLDPDKPLCDQMEALFLQPLRRLHLRLRKCQPLTFVVDALDECTSEPEITDLILALAQALREPNLPVTHILFTSRSESHICSTMMHEEVRPLVCEIPVKTSGEAVAAIISLDGADVDNDIYIFLQHSFRKLGIRHPGFPQPSRDQLGRLAIRAGRRFLVASTMMKFIDDTDNDPHDRLQLMLELTCELLPGTEVYKLYDCILSTCADPKRAYLHLSIVAALADPLPISQLSQLLGSGLGSDIETVLMQLRSVVNIPTDSTLPVDIYHTSVRDYVADPSNCSLPEVHNIPSPHSLLAYSSFHLMMKEIPRNTALLDVLSELKRQSHAMELEDPHKLKGSLAFLVQLLEPRPVIISLLWLRGDRGSDLQYWLETTDGCAWLQTQGGDDWPQTLQGHAWLDSQGGDNGWLQTSRGQAWLQTQGGQDWLQTRGGREWLEAQGGQDWLQTHGGRTWLQTMHGQDWLRTPPGKDWLWTLYRPRTQEGRDWLQTPAMRPWLKTQGGRVWLETQGGRVWLETQGGQHWLQTQDRRDSSRTTHGQDWLHATRQNSILGTHEGKDWLQTQGGKNWLLTSGGREWLQTHGGQDWLQAQGGQDWLHTLSGREWNDWLWTAGGREWLQTQGGQDWLQTQVGRVWLRGPAGRDWVQTQDGRDWLHDEGGRDWLQTKGGRAWLQTQGGRDWLQKPSMRDWLQKPGGRDWLQTTHGQDWLQTMGGKDWLRATHGHWLQTHEGQDWLQTHIGREWLQTQGGQALLQTLGGREWLRTQGGREWLQTQGGRDWLQTQRGRDWLQTPRGKDWLHTPSGHGWLQTQGGQDWLQIQSGREWLETQGGQYWLETLGRQDWLETPGGKDWLETIHGREWLQIQGGREWLQNRGGRDWLQTIRGRDWLQTFGRRNWLQTPSGHDWLQTQGG
ncbi:hypothetical protein DEU56DRAFT_862483, partial [Suillus clintonianus]|uniref:uncharacterized protein n=1 Tax=Suillus clintonianus TaxID=1904413 RepID=UPI001B868C4E